MKIVVKMILAVLMLSSVAMAEEDALVTGCKDIMKNRSSMEAGYVMGYLEGHNVLGRDALTAMELKNFQDLDFEDVKQMCKRLLNDDSDFVKDYPQYSFSMFIRGNLARANGHEWDEVEKRRDFMRKMSGFEDAKKEKEKEKKKY